MQKEPESARWPDPLADAVGLAGEHRLVEGEAAALGHLAVGDQLVARLDPDPVAGHDLLGPQLDQLAVPDRLRLRRDQQREALQRLLRLDLLPDPDVAVDHRDEAEERVGEQPEREHDDEEDADDQVEEGEDVAGDDARDRAAGAVLDRAELAQAAWRPPGWRAHRDDAGRSPLALLAKRRRGGVAGSQNHCSNCGPLRAAACAARSRRAPPPAPVALRAATPGSPASQARWPIGWHRRQGTVRRRLSSG